MKFLLTSTVKDTMSTLPPAVVRQLLEATLAWLNQQRQAGTLLESYVVPGWGLNIAIWQQETADEVAQTLIGCPLTPFPPELDRRLPPVASGLERVFILGRAVIVNRKTGAIFDVAVSF